MSFPKIPGARQRQRKAPDLKVVRSVFRKRRHISLIRSRIRFRI